MGYTETIEKNDEQIIVTLQLDEEIPRNIIPLIAYKMHFFHNKLHKFYIDVDTKKSITFYYEPDTDIADISKLSELTYGLVSEEQDALVNPVTKLVFGEKVSESAEHEFFYDKDPAIELEERGWISSFGLGQWYYGPEFTAIQMKIAELYRNAYKERMGFKECIFPKMIPIEFYLK